MKTKREYKRELNSLIEEYSKIDARVKKTKIDIEKYCSNKVYRRDVNKRIKHYDKFLEIRRNYNNSDRWKAMKREREKNNKDKRLVISKRYIEKHPWIIKERFERWAINNPRKAMLCAAASRMAMSVINRLWIRPTVCPHCGRETPNIDFHHPNHLFWWKWTFCCKSCHYYFNRDKVPASDKIIDLKQLLRESSSH